MPWKSKEAAHAWCAKNKISEQERKRIWWRKTQAKKHGFDSWEQYQEYRNSLLAEQQEKKRWTNKRPPWEIAGITHEQYTKWLKTITY